MPPFPLSVKVMRVAGRQQLVSGLPEKFHPAMAIRVSASAPDRVSFGWPATRSRRRRVAEGEAV